MDLVRPSPRSAAPLPRWLRRPAPFWLAAAGLAALSALTVGRLVADAEAARDRWGRLRPALVATVDVVAGETLSPANTELRRLPAAVLPDGALGATADGAVAGAALHAGEVVLAARVGPAGLSPAAALLPPGTRGIAVPAGVGLLPLEVGDLVDVLVADPATGEALVLAAAATVVAVVEESVTVAVDATEAPSVALAVLGGTATLALTGGD